MVAPYKTLILGDWIHLRDIIEDIYRILNEDTTLSDMTSNINVGDSDLKLVSDALSGETSDRQSAITYVSDSLSDTESEQQVISDALSALTVAAAIGGSDTHVQYNNGGLFGGDPTFTFNDVTKIVSMTGLDLTGITDDRIPYVSAAGFVDSPLFRNGAGDWRFIESIASDFLTVRIENSDNTGIGRLLVHNGGQAFSCESVGSNFAGTASGAGDLRQPNSAAFAASNPRLNIGASSGIINFYAGGNLSANKIASVLSTGFDLTGITDGDVPYMSATGFADSPITTDGTNVGVDDTSYIERLVVRQTTKDTTALRTIVDANLSSVAPEPQTALELRTRDSSGGTDLGHPTRIIFGDDHHANGDRDTAWIEAGGKTTGYISFGTLSGGTITNHVKIDSGGSTYIGDGGVTDFTTVEADGTVEFNGAATVWNDIQFEISSGKLGAANQPSWSTFTTNTSEYQFAVNDYIDLNSEELAHSWKEGTSGNFHLHVALDAANSSGANRYAQFTLYIAYVDASNDWQETSLTAELTIPDGSASLEAFYLDLGDVSFAGLSIGTQVKCRISRIAATGGTDYADEIFINQVGCHLEEDTVGSRTEAAK